MSDPLGLDSTDPLQERAVELVAKSDVEYYTALAICAAQSDSAGN